jgi:hypothetical protein
MALLGAKCSADWTVTNTRLSSARAEIAKKDVENYTNASRWMVDINDGLESLILSGKPSPKSEASAQQLNQLVEANAFAEATDKVKEFTTYIFSEETELRQKPRPWADTSRIKDEGEKRFKDALKALALWNQRSSPN